MGTLLAEPFLLGSYPPPSRRQSRSEFQKTWAPHLSATCCSKSNSENFVTLTIQGDGIHVLELSSMHTSVSHTLGPSAFFAAPATTRFDGPSASTSYAIMQAAPDGIVAKDRGRTIWRWRDQLLTRPEEQPEPRLSALVPHIVDQTWAPSDLPHHVIAVSPSGLIMLSDQDLKLISTSAEPGGVRLRSWLFKSEDCAFVSSNTMNSGGMVGLCFILKSGRLELRITLIHPAEEIRELAELNMGTYEDVVDISCDPSGYISVLAQRGEWKFFFLDHDYTGAIAMRPLADTLYLSEVLLSSYSSCGGRRKDGPTILSVGSSYILVAAIIGGPSPEIITLLWDSQFSVVLASQAVAISSTVSYNPSNPLSLELVSASRSQALLVASLATQNASREKEGAAHNRSAVFVVQFDIPSVSTVALAIGKARDTEKWLQNSHISATIKQDDSRSRMMQSVRSAAEQGHQQTAEDAFFAWVEEETLPAQSTNPVLSYQFVSSMLNIVLHSAKSPHLQHSSKIVSYLIGRRAVSHEMVEGGLIPALRNHRDWESILSSLENVSDIPESELIILLEEVVRSHRQRGVSQEDRMTMDLPAGTPSLAQFIAALVSYTTSPSTLRIALKQHLTDVRDIISVIEVLEKWVVHWCNSEFTVENTSKSARRMKSKPSRTPTFERVISFLQNLLDAHFVALLQYPPSYAIIERTAQHLKEQLVSIDEMDRVQGPLESFVRIEAKERHSRQTQKEGESDWRKKRKEAVEAAELAVGIYQVEELVI